MIAARAGGRDGRGRRPSIAAAASATRTRRRRRRRARARRAGRAGARDPAAAAAQRRAASVTRWAHVRRAVVARARPGRARARRRARRAADARGHGHGAAGDRAAHRAATAGCGCASRCRCCRTARSGWVPRRALGAYEISRHRLVVDLAPRAADAAARAAASCCARRSAIGQARWPTPRGTFLVRNRLRGLHEPAVRPGGVRDERALPDAHRLAGRRVHRHPRHRPARPRPGPGLARLRAAAQP